MHASAVVYVDSSRIKAIRVEGVQLSNAALKIFNIRNVVELDFLFDTNTLVRVKTLVQDDNCRRNMKTIQL